MENRIRNVAEDKFSELKEALKADLNEYLSPKVGAIQTKDSSSISEGISKLKTEVKTEIKTEIVNDIQPPKCPSTGRKEEKENYNLSKLKQQAFAKRHNSIFWPSRGGLR